MTAPEFAIETSALQKRYGQTAAVKRLDLQVRRGEVFGLLGPNGAGKTTTILMLLGLSEPSGGQARVLGLDPTRDALAVKRLVGYLPDNVGFYGGLTGRQNLSYTCQLNSIDPVEADARIDRWLERVGLTDMADERVERYSRGMRQRLGLADTLVKDPRILILDEPTASIDPVGVREILALVRQLVDEQGVTVLLASHLLVQVQEICDRIAIFVAGEAVAVGTVAELAAHNGRGAATSVDVGVDGESDRVGALLRDVNAASTVRCDERDRGLWHVSGETGLMEELLGALSSAGLTPWLLRDRGMDLGAIYQRYFLPSEPQSATAGDEHVEGASR